MADPSPESRTPRDPVAEAADWFALHDAGTLTPEEQLAFQSWLSESAENRDAYAQIEGAWAAFDEVRADDVPAGGSSSRLMRRRAAQRAFAPRRRRLGVLALAASLVVLAVLAPELMMRLQADAMTAVGEVRELPLPDGSLAVLDTNTAIAIDFRQDGRRVTLLKGRAEFVAATDVDRPFSVSAEGGTATALGTVFAVQNVGQGARVMVTEGRVSVVYGDARSAPERLVTAGQSVDYAAGQGIGEVASVDAFAASAWRHGRLIFENRPLAQVIEELNRYHLGTIRILDAAIGRRLVSGTFPLREPLRAVDALEASLGIKSTRIGDFLVILHS